MTRGPRRGERRRRAWRAGRRAEWLCAMVLRFKGYRIVARGYRVPVGEIDIVARRGRQLAVVEVKARRDARSAVEAVTPRQRRRIARATEMFLARHPQYAHLSVRFDLMVVVPWRPPCHMPDAWRPARPA